MNRFKLKKWLELESIQEVISEAIAANKYQEIIDGITQYVAIAYSISPNEYGWKEIVESYYNSLQVNQIDVTLVPMLVPPPQGKIEIPSKQKWDYVGRSWFSLAHIFAKNYGWSLEYIADLDVIDAFRLLQEMQMTDQLDKEWEWMLSEHSVVYDEATKKGKFNPLPRPKWMETTPDIKIISAKDIPDSMKPQGNVLRLVDGKFVQVS